MIAGNALLPAEIAAIVHEIQQSLPQQPFECSLRGTRLVLALDIVGVSIIQLLFVSNYLQINGNTYNKFYIFAGIW